MTTHHNIIQSSAAAAAVLISLAAVFFTWSQLQDSREHNRISVRPILQITPYLEGAGPDKRNGIYLSNDGLGPAIIKSFSVKSSEVVASGFGPDRWAEIIATTEANPLCFASGWPKGETAIRAGTEVPLVYLTAAKPISDLCMAEVIKLIGGKAIDIEVAYESIYEQAWHLKADSKIMSRSLDLQYRTLTNQR